MSTTTTMGAGESPWNSRTTADFGGHGMSTPHNTLGEFDYRAAANRGHGGGDTFRGMRTSTRPTPTPAHPALFNNC